MKKIVRDPNIVFGKPRFEGTRIYVALILELMAEGSSENEILENYPTLDKSDLKATLKYALKLVKKQQLKP